MDDTTKESVPPSAQETSRREMLKKLQKAAYIAPATIALLASTRASASP